MQIYLIRHAHAVEATEDPKRPLSKRGHKQTRRLGRFLRKSDALGTVEIWHSPLARSVDTARDIVEELGRRIRLVQVDALEGGDDPAIMADRLKTRRSSIALVGHEPHLSALASLLVAGVAEPPRFHFKKSAAVALERGDGTWAVRWQISPELLVKPKSKTKE
jgi:phosphohistidine phosphatase